MFAKKMTAAVMAGLMGLTSLSALAQPQPPRPPQHGGPGFGPGPQPHPPAARPQHPGHPHGMPPGHAKRMGAGPQHKWVKGTRLPREYRSHNYVVNNWQRHGLKRPPRGYQWVQYGSDYMLVAIATGVITQLILSN